MPVYEYRCKNDTLSCGYCRKGFEVFQSLSEPHIPKCPKCGNEVIKLISSCFIGQSKTDFDRRAKEAGFHKLERRDKGVFEKMY